MSFHSLTCQPPRCGFRVYEYTEDALDMAIFISPQYAEDRDILNVIDTYASAVKDDIGWNVGVVKVDKTQNRYDIIDEIIESLYQENPLKACMMVGEDMGKDLNIFTTSCNKKCDQSIVAWCTIGGTDAYEISPTCATQTVTSRLIISVPISLMYPNSDDLFVTKKAQILSAFNKFSNDRNIEYTDDILAFCDDSESIDVLEILENELPTIGDPEIIAKPYQSTVDDALSGNYKMVSALGHAVPSSIRVSSGAHLAYFTARTHAENVNTPFLLLFGCGVHGWFTGIDDICAYYPPIRTHNNWFGHTIFDNPNLRVIIAGFPTGAYARYGRDATGFLCSRCLAKMNDGVTIAEAMQNIWSHDSNETLFGDPTFHY